MTGQNLRRLLPLPALGVALCLASFALADPGQSVPAQAKAAQPTHTQSAAPGATPAQTQQPTESASTRPQPLIHSYVPSPPATPEELADSLMSHKRYQEAITSYRQAISAPHDRDQLAAIWNKLGIAYQMMFNLDEATDCYRKSLHLRPHNADVLNNLGTVYDAQKEYGSARRMYKKAIKINRHNALYYKNLGTNYITSRKYKEGWKTYQEALAIDPTVFGPDNRPHTENPATLTQRGAMNYYLAKGCVKAHMPLRAIDYLRRAIDEGFVSPDKVARDHEFASLHQLPAFKQLIAEQKNHH